MDLDQLNSIREQLNEWINVFKVYLGRSERVHWCRLYISGLILDGERKSIEPMAKRLPYCIHFRKKNCELFVSADLKKQKFKKFCC
ncbi:transposase [Neochlamydia sp. S13]|uniref:transposase n=1 Tax=Neochlamydia sp. S13 TaxID=1353976 RepID=UPI0005A81AD9|nr:transposase [Neochlamydia sp. S13]BBI16576.1 Transposase [Neochlamydia sp. S13]